MGSREGRGSGLSASGAGGTGAPAAGSGPTRAQTLENELAEAQTKVRTLSAELERERRANGPGKDETQRLESLISARTRELAEKSDALEAANRELTNLMTNLDQIVRQRTRALAESEVQLRRKNAELDRLNRMKSEFISIAAHELRTPMTSIIGYLDLISQGRMGELPETLKRPLASLHRNAGRLKRLIEDMLDISRLEGGRMTLHRAPRVLQTIVDAAVEELRPFAQLKQHAITVAPAPAGMPRVDVDESKLHQVVANLLANSIKYTPEGGRIELRTDVAEGGKQARLIVRDNGIGIPKELLDRIWEPFSDVNTAKHHTSHGPDSAGLGLYIAKGIVEPHGGQIVVSSEEGTFTEFVVTMPVAKS